MTSRGALVAAEVATWEKTPFAPHQRVKGRGVDCKGLPWGVAAELGFPEAQSEYARDTDYNLGRRGGIPAVRLKEGFAALFDPVPFEDREPGDLLLCKWDGRAGHVAIYAGNDRAWNALPDAGVRCRTLRSLFHKFPLDSVWRWRA